MKPTRPPCFRCVLPLLLAAVLAPAAAQAPPPDPQAQAWARQQWAQGLDALAPWAGLAAVAGRGAELEARATLAHAAMAAQSAGTRAQWGRIVRQARDAGRHDHRRLALAHLSNLGYRAGDYAFTRAIEQEALADARRYGDLREEAGSLQDLGLVATATGDLDASEKFHRDALAIWERLDHPMGQARALRGLGRVLEARGRYPQAVDVQVAGLELMLRHGTPIEQSESYYSLARLFMNLEDYDAAIRGFGLAIELMGPTPPDFPLGLNLAGRSGAERLAGQPQAALASAEQALAAFERSGSPVGEAIGKLMLGDALTEVGRGDDAQARLQEGIAIAERLGEDTLKSDLLLAQGRGLVATGRPREALAPLEQAIGIGDRLGLDRLRQDASLELEKAHSALGDSAAALAWSKRAFEFRSRLTRFDQLGEAASQRLAGGPEAARRRFMSLDPAAIAAERRLAEAEAADTAAPAEPAWPREWLWALLLPTLLLAWWLVRVTGHARRLRADKDRMSARARELQSAHDTLRHQSDRLRAQISIDPLTGCLTRAAFAAELAALLAHADNHGRSVALLVFDLDHFKTVNDRHGHLAGDQALRLVTGITREKLRSVDLLGRFGGDEFLVACEGLDSQGAEALAERMRFDVVWRAPEQDPPMPELSISVGVAVADPSRGYDPESLFKRADVALYRAKRAGRNRVQADEPGYVGDPDDRRLRQWGEALTDG